MKIQDLNKKDLHTTAGAMILLVVIAAGNQLTYKQAAIQIEEIIKWRDENERGDSKSS